MQQLMEASIHEGVALLHWPILHGSRIIRSISICQRLCFPTSINLFQFKSDLRTGSQPVLTLQSVVGYSLLSTLLTWWAQSSLKRPVQYVDNTHNGALVSLYSIELWKLNNRICGQPVVNIERHYCTVSDLPIGCGTCVQSRNFRLTVLWYNLIDLIYCFTSLTNDNVRFTCHDNVILGKRPANLSASDCLIVLARFWGCSFRSFCVNRTLCTSFKHWYLFKTTQMRVCH